MGQRPEHGDRFPFLFGGTFIEEQLVERLATNVRDFPSFSEGLSLRIDAVAVPVLIGAVFPFLFGGTFIEETVGL